MIAILLISSGCIDGFIDELPNVDATWAGTIESVQVHDARGGSYQAAALRITEGPIPDWNVPEELGGGRMPLLAHDDDGIRIMPPSELPRSRPVRVNGMMIIRGVGNPVHAEQTYGGAHVARELDLLNRWEHIIIVEGAPKGLER